MIKRIIILEILVLGLLWGLSCNHGKEGIRIITKKKWDTSRSIPRLIQEEIKEYRLPDFPEKIIEDGTLRGWTYSLAEFFENGFTLFISSAIAGSETRNWALSFPFCYGKKTGRPVIVIIAGLRPYESYSPVPICAYYADDLRAMTAPWNLPSGYPYDYPRSTSQEEEVIKVIETLKPELDKIIEKLVKFYKKNQ